MGQSLSLPGSYAFSPGKDPDVAAYNYLGAAFVAQTVGLKLQEAQTASNLTDGQQRWVAVYVPQAATITGVRWYQRVAGSYTADNNNRVGLYSINPSDGSLTLVASCANDTALWTPAANTFGQKAFSSTYAAAAGVYYVGLIYNNSAQTTAPQLSQGVALSNAAQAALWLGNSMVLYGTSNETDLPASKASSGLTGTTAMTWVALY